MQLTTRKRGWIRRRHRRLRAQAGSAIARHAIRTGADLGRLYPAANPARHGIEVIKDIEYRRTGNPAHRLDVYRPKHRNGPLPVVIYIHGGAFHLLSKDTHWLMGLGFARAGYLVFNVDYRLAPENPFPAAVSDVCAALEWVAEHGEPYGGDLTQLVFAGESAGGNLATALTICCCYERPEPFAQRAFETGVVPTVVAPACAALQVTNPNRLNRKGKLPKWVRATLVDMRNSYLYGRRDPSTTELELIDPLRVFERGAAPDRELPGFFLPIGTRDPLLDDTRRLDRALRAMGVECEARYYEGELHAFHALIWRKQARRCWREQLAFMDRLLEERPEPYPALRASA